jgi:type VI secretion system protein ImpJ
VKRDIESETADIHWYEGMFLLPHHHQTASRRSLMLEREKITSITPFFWGIVDLQINAAALSGNRIKVDRAVLRLKDGTWLNIPDNAHAAEKSFARRVNFSN